MLNPTKETYDDFNKAYDFFNKRLFGGTLPRCLITMQRQKKSYGYFSGDRWAQASGDGITDEIAMNPAHFIKRPTNKTLSTLVHEMVHLWQHHFGNSSRGGYHNKEWGEKMEALGLVPSSTGAPGGKTTGQKVSHYIAVNGKFAKACTSLIGRGFEVPYVDRAGDDDETQKKKSASRSKYTCPTCGLNAWGKPGINIVCGDCDDQMISLH